MPDSENSIPAGIIADPTSATTKQMLREIENLGDKFEGRLLALERGFNSRLDAMDKAVSLLSEYPTEVDKAVARLGELIEAKLSHLHELYDITTNRVISLEGVDNNQSSIAPRLSVVESNYNHISSLLDDRINSQKEAVVVALSAADKAIAAALAVAERAAAKVELSADKSYLQAQIEGLKETFSQQIGYQKDASAAALASAERAVNKAENQSDNRSKEFAERVADLSNKQSEFVAKTEVDFRIKAVEDKLNTAVNTLSEGKGKSAGVALAWAMAVGAITIAAVIIGATAAIINLN